MATEEEKRLHRCCFTGHRPEKLNATEEEVKLWLEEQIDRAIADGYVTFISGCSMGIDIWAAQIVLRKKADNPNIHLIAATPWPGFARRWNEEWKSQYNDLLHQADITVNVCDHYHKGVFQQRNVWMVDRSNRVKKPLGKANHLSVQAQKPRKTRNDCQRSYSTMRRL